MTADRQDRIAQLERDKRWWKRLATAALSALAILLIITAGLGVYQYQQVRVARELEARAAAEAEARRNEVQRTLYFHRVAAAHHELEKAGRADEKKP